MMCPIAEKRAKAALPISSGYPTLQFDELVGYLKVHLSLLPDARKGHNVTYRIQDAALGAMSFIFSTSKTFARNKRTK